MATVIASLGCFITAVFIHLFLCRRSRSNDLQAKLFIIIAALGLVIFLSLVVYFQMTFILTAGIIYVLLVPVYLIFYVCTVLVSPSKKVLQIIESRQGATYEQILTALEEERFIPTRLDELVQSGCMECREGHYRLTPSGKKIASVLNIYQCFLGRKIGG